ncbi:MAG: universal stress protein [Porticoccus sp.]|nr:universal stress protein [Porticoccus sp.]
MNTIFVAVDLRSDVEGILDVAKDLAKTYDAELVLATVETELPGAEGVEEDEENKVVDELSKSYGKEIHELHTMARNISAEGINCRAIILEGVRAHQLSHAANEMDADLIILGNHGHSPLYDTLIGGTASGIIQFAKQKVLLVPVDD